MKFSRGDPPISSWRGALLGELRETVLSSLFPPRCPICDRVLSPGERICPSCVPCIRPMQRPLCLKCGRGIASSCSNTAMRFPSPSRGSNTMEGGSISPFMGSFPRGLSERGFFRSHWTPWFRFRSTGKGFEGEAIIRRSFSRNGSESS